MRSDNQGRRRSLRREQQRSESVNNSENNDNNQGEDEIQLNIDRNNAPQQLNQIMELESSFQDEQQEQDNELDELRIGINDQPNEMPNQKVAPSRFLKKIPNTKVMRDFFINSGRYYVPPIRDLTSKFLRVITAYFVINQIGSSFRKKEIDQVKQRFMN